MSITAPVELESAQERIEIDDLEIVQRADDLTIISEDIHVEKSNLDQQLLPFLACGVVTLLAMLVLAGVLAL